MKNEIMVPALDIPVTKELLYDTVRDTYRNIKGMLALQQQFYFFSLNTFQKIAETDEDSMIKISCMNFHLAELMENLSLSGVTKLDIVVNPSTVEVRYPEYDSRWEYRDTSMYNTVCIENPPENPVRILRIEKKGSHAPELCFVRKRERWSMKNWSEVLLYADRNLFEERVNGLLQFFGIPQEDFDYVLSLEECKVNTV